MEVSGWCIGSGCCVIWPLKVVVCLKTGDLLSVPLHKGKEERSECMNYRSISLLSICWKNICLDLNGQSL